MKWVSIQEVAEVNPKVPKSVSEQTNASVTFLPMAAVSEEGTIDILEEAELGDVIKGYRYFEEGDALLAKITPCMENGKATFVEGISHKIGFGSTEFHVLRPKADIFGRYLFYMVWNPAFRHIAELNMTGTAGQRRVPTDFVKRYKIPLPPLEEQRRIAAILDKADGVRRKRKEAIALTEELLRSVFLDMFGDPITNPKGWEMVKLENIIRLVSGQVDPKQLPYSEMLHVGGDNIESGTGEITGCKTPAELSLISGKYLFREGDILYSKIRPYLNKVSLPDFNGVCSADIYPIRVNREHVTPTYVASILRSEGFLDYAEKHSTRTNIPKINRKALMGFECPLPPLELQNQFATVAKRIFSIKCREKTGVEEVDSLFSSLLQRAFQGEL